MQAYPLRGNDGAPIVLNKQWKGASLLASSTPAARYKPCAKDIVTNQVLVKAGLKFDGKLVCNPHLVASVESQSGYIQVSAGPNYTREPMGPN